MPRKGFKWDVEKRLTGREKEPHEITYFKVYRSTDSSGRIGHQDRRAHAGHG
jgi:hypothetical protein